MSKKKNYTPKEENKWKHSLAQTIKAKIRRMYDINTGTSPYILNCVEQANDILPNKSVLQLLFFCSVLISYRDQLSISHLMFIENRTSNWWYPENAGYLFAFTLSIP